MTRQPIHKDNYEEYFLLYVDNELTAEERAAVDAFVLVHPDLKAELDMYLDTRLTPEFTAFDGKDSLLKEEDEVHAGNIEELQVRWMDGELDPLLAEKTATYTHTHPEALQDFEWLKKTRLPMELIPFPDKASLYRHAEQPAVVVRMRWIRVAIAAALILSAGLWWFNREDNAFESVQPGIAQSGQSTTGTPDEINPRKDSLKSVSPIGEQNTTANTIIASATRPSDPPQQVQTTAKRQDAPVTYAAVERTTSVDVVEVVPEAGRNESLVTTPELRPTMGTQAVVQETLAMNVKTDYVTDALYQEQSGAQDDYAGDEQRQRKGFRGLIRKVNRFYNKATNPDPEKAMVKVASFEIGLPR